MTQIALIRPGASDYDAQGRIQGNLKIPLNEDGHQEVGMLAAQLRDQGLEVIYAAASEPAIETAELLARQTGTKVKRLDSLRNVNLGLWEGCSIDEVRRKHPKVYRQWEEKAENVCPPQGETFGEARGRIEPILQKLLKKHRNKKIGLVVPQPLFDVIHQCLSSGKCGESVVQCDVFGHWNLLSTGATPVS